MRLESNPTLTSNVSGLISTANKSSQQIPQMLTEEGGETLFTWTNKKPHSDVLATTHNMATGFAQASKFICSVNISFVLLLHTLRSCFPTHTPRPSGNETDNHLCKFQLRSEVQRGATRHINRQKIRGKHAFARLM